MAWAWEFEKVFLPFSHVQQIWRINAYLYGPNGASAEQKAESSIVYIREAVWIKIKKNLEYWR